MANMVETLSKTLYDRYWVFFQSSGVGEVPVALPYGFLTEFWCNINVLITKNKHDLSCGYSLWDLEDKTETIKSITHKSYKYVGK